ncbi:MAG: hypothetical protein JJU29_06835 [Verrucomicrobia bacterium]|nr:hypothetical protein [Verrucomicrobiota bacterium]MCH8512376.1 hypothetical protein [Kiritimatiellia bacterium]
MTLNINFLKKSSQILFYIYPIFLLILSFSCSDGIQKERNQSDANPDQVNVGQINQTTKSQSNRNQNISDRFSEPNQFLQRLSQAILNYNYDELAHLTNRTQILIRRFDSEPDFRRSRLIEEELQKDKERFNGNIDLQHAGPHHIHQVLLPIIGFVAHPSVESRVIEISNTPIEKLYYVEYSLPENHTLPMVRFSHGSSLPGMIGGDRIVLVQRSVFIFRLNTNGQILSIREMEDERVVSFSESKLIAAQFSAYTSTLGATPRNRASLKLSISGDERIVGTFSIANEEVSIYPPNYASIYSDTRPYSPRIINIPKVGSNNIRVGWELNHPSKQDYSHFVTFAQLPSSAYFLDDSLRPIWNTNFGNYYLRKLLWHHGARKPEKDYPVTFLDFTW